MPIDFLNEISNPDATSTPTSTASLTANPPVTNNISSPAITVAQQTANSITPVNNDTVESIAAALTSGVLINDNNNTNNQTQTANNGVPNNPEPVSNDPNNPKPSQPPNPVEAILASFGQTRLIDGIDLDKFRTDMEAGADVSTIENFVEEASQAGVQRAIQSVLNIIPELAQHIQDKVLEKVSSNNTNDRTWQEFLGEYPDYKPHEHMVRQQLESAMKSGKDRAQVYQAIDLIFSNLKGAPAEDPNSGIARVQQGSKAFDLAAYNE